MKNLQLPLFTTLGGTGVVFICTICRHYIGTGCGKKRKSEAFLTKRHRIPKRKLQLNICVI
jgi:hypothetical protein